MHAYVDETKAAGLLVVSTVVRPADASAARKALTELRMKGQSRIHFTKESPSRRRLILSTLETLAVEAVVYDASHIRDQREARRCALGAVVRDLAVVQAQRLVIELDDSLAEADRRTLFAATREHGIPGLSYEHVRPTAEPILWVSDAIAWCAAKGGDWKRRAAPIVRETVIVPR
ncbi:hypothetical protein HNP11_004161 [Tsukamurella ocularis]|uniref:hypothetical protein n=1 Tax=Tsukamurella ocularis TaxID=1970234 RepID=UPI0021673DFE|nr:hypothetical protein [Tsukamurella ocularis]MCS3789963.1 hypothetical protein [Tsukamurella ocularis]